MWFGSRKHRLKPVLTLNCSSAYDRTAASRSFGTTTQSSFLRYFSASHYTVTQPTKPAHDFANTIWPRPNKNKLFFLFKCCCWSCYLLNIYKQLPCAFLSIIVSFLFPSAKRKARTEFFFSYGFILLWLITPASSWGRLWLIIHCLSSDISVSPVHETLFSRQNQLRFLLARSPILYHIWYSMYSKMSSMTERAWS